MSEGGGEFQHWRELVEVDRQIRAGRTCLECLRELGPTERKVHRDRCARLRKTKLQKHRRARRR